MSGTECLLYIKACAFQENESLLWVKICTCRGRLIINLLTPNDDYSGRTAPLTSKCCILYIYSTNTGTEYFKHGIYSPFFPLQNAVCFINLTYLIPVLFTFYIQCVPKLKKNNSGAKRLTPCQTLTSFCGEIMHRSRLCADQRQPFSLQFRVITYSLLAC